MMASARLKHVEAEHDHRPHEGVDERHRSRLVCWRAGDRRAPHCAPAEQAEIGGEPDACTQLPGPPGKGKRGARVKAVQDFEGVSAPVGGTLADDLEAQDRRVLDRIPSDKVPAHGASLASLSQKTRDALAMGKVRLGGSLGRTICSLDHSKTNWYTLNSQITTEAPKPAHGAPAADRSRHCRNVRRAGTCREAGTFVQPAACRSDAASALAPRGPAVRAGRVVCVTR